MSRKGKSGIGGKQILLLGLVALVITAGYYRWTLENGQYESMPVSGDALPVAGEGGDADAKAEDKNAGKGITALKEERDKSRGEMMDEWKKTAESDSAGAETKQDAREKIKNHTEYTEKEKSMEVLIQAKGYQDAFVKMNESGITVVVSGGELDGAKVAQIKDIVVGETGISVGNIKISAE